MDTQKDETAATTDIKACPDCGSPKRDSTPKENVEKEPTPPPGELVFEYKRTTSTSNNRFLEFEVRRLEAGKHVPASFDGDKRVWFEAHLSARDNCFYRGDTLEESIAALLLGSALLSRWGSMNPNSPTEKGAPILQHVMEILQERQAWHLGLRKSWIHSEFDTPGEEPLELEKDDLKPFLRHSEAIGAISTALAALARVKDL